MSMVRVATFILLILFSRLLLPCVLSVQRIYTNTKVVRALPYFALCVISMKRSPSAFSAVRFKTPSDQLTRSKPGYTR